jgi:hypothetical protein
MSNVMTEGKRDYHEGGTRTRMVDQRVGRIPVCISLIHSILGVN